VGWIWDTAVIDGTYLGAARRFSEAHALSALIGVDYIDRLSLSNRLVFAFGLASAATDALIGNLIGHLYTSFFLLYDRLYYPGLSLMGATPLVYSETP
jgi:hypothetical protein